MEEVKFAYWEEDAVETWREILKPELENSSRFEIRLWNDDTELTQLLLQFGNLMEENWEYGVIVEGNVDEDFIDFLCSFEPEEREGQIIITPFYSIVLDHFVSEQYGRELKRL